MRVISHKALTAFFARWPTAAKPLNEWYRRTLNARWSNFTDVKATFGQTDQARVKSGATVAIFDIGGNKFRLVAMISYRKGKVYVLRVMTHKQYDRDPWKEQL
jgi:mRNA interferase HigB